MGKTDWDKADETIEAILAIVVLVPAVPFLIGYFLALAAVQAVIKAARLLTTGRLHPRPQPKPRHDAQVSPRYFAHAPDGRVIGEFDTVEECEVAGLLACGVKPVDLPLALHERRRLGTYGSLRDPEPARADQLKQPAAPARPSGRPADASPSPTWGERIGKAPDLRKAYPPKRLSGCRGPYR